MTDATLAPTALTDLLSRQWQAIAELVGDLDETGWRTPSPLPGWTVFDVVAHIVGTESMLLGEKPPARDPERPEIDMRTLPHVHNEIGIYNEIWLERLRPRPGARLAELFAEVTDRRRAALAALTDEQWATPGPSPVGEVSYARFMRVRLFDCWMHELDVADGLGRTVDEGGPRAEAAFTELLSSLGKAVVKGAQAPDGSRVTIAVTGPVTRNLHFVVDGRATLVDELDAEPTATLQLDSGLFARLRGGRTVPEAHPGAYRVTGDTELGERLAHHLAFTI